MPRIHSRGWLLLAPLLLTAGSARAAEDIAFIAEHLPEVAMDNRYASVPLLSPTDAAPGWHFGAGLGYTRIDTGRESLAGPLASLAAGHELGRARVTILAFHDPLDFNGGREHRPLGEPFVATPLSLPVAAEFSGLQGSAHDSGVGFLYTRPAHFFGVGDFDASFGLLWQRVTLDGYRSTYTILEGPQAGAAGLIDFSGTYEHFVPMVDLAKSFSRGAWRFDPRVRFAMPLPRRAMVGRITGPGFDLSGNTADFGAGKHFGDPSVTLGFDVTYLPWNLTVDAGALVSQALIEPFVHEGVTADWILDVRWSPSDRR